MGQLDNGVGTLLSRIRWRQLLGQNYLVRKRGGGGQQ